MKITHQGAPIVNDMVILKQYDDIVALEVDLSTKYCEVSGICGNGLFICCSEATKNACGSYNTDVDFDEATFIEFDEFPNFGVFSTELGRYTLCVCLVKR